MNNNENVKKLETLLNKEICSFSNMYTYEIIEKLNIQSKAKNINSLIFNEILKNSKNYDEIINLVNVLKCKIKTVSLEWNNNLKESMSLSAFKYCDIVQETWDCSILRKYFIKNTFIFVVFKKDNQGTMLDSICVWKMPIRILDKYVKETWEYTKKLITEGHIVKYIDSRNRMISYFPTSSETRYIHVRPHAQNSKDVIPLPVEDEYTHLKYFTRHSFWLNSSFIRKIVVEKKYYE